MQSWSIRSGFWSGTPSRGTAVGFRPIRAFAAPRRRCTVATAAPGRSRPSSCSRGRGGDGWPFGSGSRPVDWPRSVCEVSGSTPTEIDLTPSRPRSGGGNAGCSSFSAGAVEALADWGWERAAERAVPRRKAPGRGPAGLRTRRGGAAVSATHAACRTAAAGDDMSQASPQAALGRTSRETDPAVAGSISLEAELPPRPAGGLFTLTPRRGGLEAPTRDSCRGTPEAPVRGHSHDWFPAALRAGDRPRGGTHRSTQRRRPGPETDPGLTPCSARGCAVGAISHAIPRHRVRRYRGAPAARATPPPLIAATGGRRRPQFKPLAKPRRAFAQGWLQEVVRPSRSFSRSNKNPAPRLRPVARTSRP